MSTTTDRKEALRCWGLEIAPKSFPDLSNPGVVLVIWDLLLGIPFSIFIALVNKAFMQWLGYEKTMRCPSVFATRAIIVLVNLAVVLSWRKQLIQGGREARFKLEVEMLDEINACLEKVLAGVEAKEIDEQIINESEGYNGGDESSIFSAVDKKASTEWNQKKLIARKVWKESQLDA